MTTPLIRKKLMQSPSFRRWFGDSKVIDRDGLPLVVYHGTALAGYTESTNIHAFEHSKIGDRWSSDQKGFFFTTDKRCANYYTASDHDYREPGSGQGAVYPVYISLKRPLIIDAEFLKAEGMAAIGQVEDTVSWWDTYQSLALEWAESRRADGIILRDSVIEFEGSPVQMVIAFKPEQIKSALGNHGEYHRHPDITY